MDKISSILPSSARVSSVDMREAAPVRPGAPGFGRPEGASSLREREKEVARAMAARADATTAQRGNEALQAQMDWRAKEDRGAAIAKTMSEKFFVDRRKEAEAALKLDRGPERSSDALGGVALGTSGALGAASRAANAREVDARGIGAGQRFGPSANGGPEASPLEADALPSPDEFYPRGSFIDYRA